MRGPLAVHMNYLRMESIVKKIIPCLSFTLAALLSTNSSADACGEGKITKIYAGGWNSQDILLIVDNSVSGPDATVASTLFNGMLRISKASLRETERETQFANLHAAALSAFHAGTTVRAFTHWGQCHSVTELMLTK